jgi:hypothetical protein
LKPRVLILLAAATLLFAGVSWGQSDLPAANSSNMDFKQFGLLAIQDGGRRKPIDTFAREALIRITDVRHTPIRLPEMAAERFCFCRRCSTHAIGKTSQWC